MDLRLGSYRDVLADATWDALICDPPYSARTHTGHDAGEVRHGRRGLTYAAWSPDDVRDFVSWAAPRTRSWMVCMTDDALAPVWREAMEAQGRISFAPIPWTVPGSRRRAMWDGPPCWSVQIMVSRPRGQGYVNRWPHLPGEYRQTDRDDARYIGGKPLSLMRAIVRDYTRGRPDWLVCDPCAGWGTTLIAAAIEGRRGLGAEMDAETHATALARYQSPQVQQEIAAADWLRGMDAGAGQASLLGGEE